MKQHVYENPCHQQPVDDPECATQDAERRVGKRHAESELMLANIYDLQ